MLHEFGHIATSCQKEKSKSEVFTHKASFNDELKADEWAAKKLADHGKKFYHPFVQLRAILWLFDLMHFVEVIEQRKKMMS